MHSSRRPRWGIAPAAPKIRHVAWWRPPRQGVRFYLTGIVASSGVTIVEGNYENPADDPNHCPPTHTEVRFHPQGPATRVILYYGSPDDDESMDRRTR